MWDIDIIKHIKISTETKCKNRYNHRGRAILIKYQNKKSKFKKLYLKLRKNISVKTLGKFTEK